MENKQNFYYIIPAKLVENENSTKALLYGLIVSLSNKSGYCWASNKFLADKLNKSKSLVSKYISELEKEKWLKTTTDKENGNKRKVYIGRGGIVTDCHTYSNELREGYSNELRHSNISNSNINKYKEIFSYWNKKDIVKHRKLTSKRKTKIRSALRDYSPDEIKKAIDNYAKVFKGDDYWWTHKWTLENFLSRGLDEFFSKSPEDYKAGKNGGFGDNKKKPYWNGNKMVKQNDKWYVLTDDGDKLTFEGDEDEIRWKNK